MYSTDVSRCTACSVAWHRCHPQDVQWLEILDSGQNLTQYQRASSAGPSRRTQQTGGIGHAPVLNQQLFFLIYFSGFGWKGLSVYYFILT